ncbi:chemotaxis protein CheW [Shewanella sp. SNU WT4]|uniref:chemotaxis protein CheW n=1 Tax=Shewanella sp. SNU WT4 TaxID=2590015 RepID=UPI00112780EC|nr:chemotaxis protein CheW [Shewanella sp. SNU WT4]QDF67663.1 chemotaxis protein CheW [Shewanella sp. SNU WT4]
MPKSVDETVLEYFNVLLAEPKAPSITSAKVTEMQGLTNVSATKASVGSTAPTAKIDDSYDDYDDYDDFDDVVTKQLTKAPYQWIKSSLETKYPFAPKSREQMLDKSALEKLLAPLFQANTIEAVAQSSQTINTLLVTDKQDIELNPISSEPFVETRLTESAFIQTELATQTGMSPPNNIKDLAEVLENEFQVLFFKVAGLLLAVPLVNLGGIVRLERMNHIIGRPSWYLGVQLHRSRQVNVVNTCAWVMPEKYDNNLAQGIRYQYVVLLENSNWGIACESLVNAVKIDKSQINWRNKPGKRPWLAGVIREQMCGILNVPVLIQMLDAGLSCQDPLG